MSDEPVPMLNRPLEGQSETAEEFAQNVLGRMDRAHASFIDQSHLVEPAEEARERLEKFREEAFARIEGITGLTFDRQTGKCTTPMEARGDSRQARARWNRVCEELGAKPDTEKSEQLWKEAGRIVRGEAETPEVKPTDS